MGKGEEARLCVPFPGRESQRSSGTSKPGTDCSEEEQGEVWGRLWRVLEDWEKSSGCVSGKQTRSPGCLRDVLSIGCSELEGHLGGSVS